MIFVDTSFLLAVINPRDKLFARAKLWSEYLDESLFTTEYVLVEFANAYSRIPDRAKAHEVMSWVIDGPEWIILESATELFAAGVELHRKRPDKEWSLTDCMSFFLMQSRGLTRALTHDHHFEQAGFEALLRRDPP